MKIENIQEQMIKDHEANNKLKARIGTIATGLLVLILLFFMVAFKAPFPPPEEEGILVNLGYSNVGSGKIQPETKSPAAPTPPKAAPPAQPEPQATPAPADEELLTQKAPSAVKVPEKKVTKKKTEPKKKQTKPKTKTPPTPQKKAEPAEKPTPTPPKPTVNKRALYPGNKNTNSSGEGNDAVPGDKGDPSGQPGPGAYSGTNSGLGKSGVGYSLAGRKMVEAPSVSDNSNTQGKITVVVTVDQNGKVINAKIGKPTTISSPSLVQKSVSAAYRAKFNANKDAAEEQFGTITFVFKVT